MRPRVGEPEDAQKRGDARESLAISAGLGVTLPTAEDVDYSLAVSGTVDYADGISADTNTTFSTVFANETIYLLPFMAWA